MSVDLDIPAGTEAELAASIARLDDVTYAGLGPDDRERYDKIARLFFDLIAQDDYHWGCTSAEGVADRCSAAWNEAWEKSYETAKQRVIDGLARLEKATMVEAEAVVQIVPRIREMGAWDNDEPTDADDFEGEGV